MSFFIRVLLQQPGLSRVEVAKHNPEPESLASPFWVVFDGFGGDFDRSVFATLPQKRIRHVQKNDVTFQLSTVFYVF